MPENELAWDIYWDSRAQDGLSALLHSLRDLHLSIDEAYWLSIQLRTIDATLAPIEARQRQEELDNRLKNK